MYIFISFFLGGGLIPVRHPSSTWNSVYAINPLPCIILFSSHFFMSRRGEKTPRLNLDLVTRKAKRKSKEFRTKKSAAKKVNPSRNAINKTMLEGSQTDEGVRKEAVQKDGPLNNSGRREPLAPKEISRPSTSKYEFRSKQTELTEKKTANSRYKRTKSPVIRPAVNRVFFSLFEFFSEFLTIAM